MAHISTGKLRKNYSSFEEFESYCKVYNLHNRLGYKNPKTAWTKNPLVQWSTNPADFKKIKHKQLTYSRKPTASEIKFGHGATHYKDFLPSLYLNKNGQIKKRLKCPVDGLIYTR